MKEARYALRCSLHLLVFVVYVAFIPGGVYCSIQFLKQTEFQYEAPQSSMVDAAVDVASGEDMRSAIGSHPVYMIMREANDADGNCRSIVNDPTFEDLSDWVSNFSKPLTYRIDGYFATPKEPDLQAHFVGGACGELSLMILSPKEPSTFAAQLKDKVAQFFSYSENEGSNITVDYTSDKIIADDLVHGILGDLGVIDAVAVPISFLVFGWCLSSVTLTVVPLLTIVATLSMTFSIMYPISLHWKVSSFAPEMCAAVVVAMSIDYALFMSARFQEEAEIADLNHFGSDAERSDRIVKRAWKGTLHNIAASGITIALALGGLVFVPVPFISSIGVAFFVGALSAVIVSLTLTPAVLRLFFSCFIYTIQCSCKRAPLPQDAKSDIEVQVTWRVESQSLLSLDIVKSRSTAGTLREIKEERHQLQVSKEEKSLWYRMGIFAYERPLIVTAIIVGLCIPFAYEASQMKTDFNLFTSVQRDSQSALLLHEIMSDIGDGRVIPIYVVFESLFEGGVLTDNFFSVVQLVTDAIVTGVGQPKDRIYSFASPPPLGINITAEFAEFLLGVSDLYRWLYQSSVSISNTSAVIRLYPPVAEGVFGTSIGAYFDRLNAVLRDHQHLHPNVTVVGFFGASATSWAIQTEVMRFFPTQIGITFAIVSVLMWGLFRSLFIPLRMIFTVLCTLGVSYGCGAIVFQHSWLHPVWPALRDVVAYHWTVPIFSFSLLCALALDYDIFLLTRIVEKKLDDEKNDDKNAIAIAVARTGRVISCAGVIMAVSFGSMVFSKVTMLNEFGMLAAIAALFDTFVVRTWLVPALMSIAPSLTWWPRKFPAPIAPASENDPTF